MRPLSAPVADRITVRVAQTRGSVPREVGATMQVFSDHIEGTIGGGALEWEAIRMARDMLPASSGEVRHTFPLGPDLGQCCGGVVVLDFMRDPTPARAPKNPLFIWGAGHVGRAIAATIAPLDAFDITLVDDAATRLPAQLPPRVAPLVAIDMPRAVTHLTNDADHFILTYSHDIDLALCDALLRHGFRTCGLIGSATKWARFRKRLAQMSHADAQISRICCPIGDPNLGKQPQAIAIGVAARLLGGQMPQESADTAPPSGGT